MAFITEIAGERWAQFMQTNGNVGKSKPDQNYKKYWWISDHGRVKITTNYNQIEIMPKVSLSGGHEQKRYACLSVNYAPSKYIHRLVATYFIPNPEGLATVNHIDHNPLNNHYTNLEWSSYKENIRHRMQIHREGLNEESLYNYSLAREELISELPRASKYELVRDLRSRGMKIREISSQTGIPRGTVSSIIKWWRNQ